MMIITLVGSTKFKAEFEKAARQFALNGHIVLSPGIYSQSDGIELDDDTLTRLKELHEYKIDFSDAIYVINPGGYIGEATKSEISYAKSRGCLVDYLEKPSKS